jgi:tetratricopeptide (TPR) repeat protein
MDSDLTDALLLQAQENERAGRLAEAEAVYRRVLESNAENFHALFALGDLANRRSDPKTALPFLEKAVRLNGQFLPALRSLALSLIALDRIEHAIRCLERITNLAPDSPLAWYDLACALFRARRAHMAEAPLRRVIELQPDPDAYCKLAEVLESKGRIGEAEEMYRHAIRLQPDHATAYDNLSILLAGLDPKRDTVRLFAAAARGAQDPGAIPQRFLDATAVCEAAIRSDPTNPDRYIELCNWLALAGRLDDVEAAGRRAVELAPQRADLVGRLGSLLLMAVGQTDKAVEAAELLQRACVLEPCNHGYHQQLGLALRLAGRSRAAVESLERAHELEPSDWMVQYYYSDALLFAGDYDRGFRMHECTMQGARECFQDLPGVSDARLGYRLFPRPRWDGNAIRGRRLLVYSEFGFGEMLQMLRFLSPAKERSQAEIIVEAPKEIFSLVAGNPAVSEVVRRQPDRKPPRTSYDFVIDLNALAAMTCTDSGALPTYEPYVVPPAKRVEAWRKRLDDRAGFRVGICWTGAPTGGGSCWVFNPVVPVNDVRSCSPADFAGIASVPGVQLFSLQTGNTAKEALELPAGVDLIDLAPQLTDFGETAAAMVNMDAIVTVDTAVAHLAGALGRPTYVLLSQVPYWTWMIDRDDSPWYPGVRLMRRTAGDGWQPVFAKVEREIRDLVGRN